MRWVPLFALMAMPVYAQQQPAPTPSEQALSNKLGAEIGLGLKCNTELITLQAELAKAQARIKQLEAGGAAEHKPEEGSP